MLQRLLICGLLLYVTATIDIGLPTWIAAPVLPACLSLLLVIFCQILQRAELAFWAGAVGFCQDFVAGMSPGWGVMTAATLGLFIALQSPQTVRRINIADRLLNGLGLLLLVELLHGGIVYFQSPEVSPKLLLISTLTRVAATYLLYVLLSLTWTGIRFFSRRSYRLDQSCL